MQTLVAKVIELVERNTTKLILYFSDFSRIFQSLQAKHKKGWTFCRKDPRSFKNLAIGSQWPWPAWGARLRPNSGEGGPREQEEAWGKR